MYFFVLLAVIVPLIFSIYFFVKALIVRKQRKKQAMEIIKSLRLAKKMRNSSLELYSGKPCSGYSLHYNDYIGGKK